MKFANPQWLWCLLLLPAIYAFALADGRRRRAQFEKFVDAKLWHLITPELDPRAPLRKTVVGLLSIAFVLLALARPQWGMHEETMHVSGLDVMVLLDVSNSMLTEDVMPSRLQKAKHLIRTLTDHLRGDRVGLVGFAGGAAVTCPLTTDLDYLMESVQILTPQMVPAQGTDIGVGLDTAYKALDRGAEDSPDGDASTAAQSRAIVLITDGEDHEDKGDDEARVLKQRGVKLYVLGVGTQKGGPIPMRDVNGNLTGYKKDRHGETVVSVFHPDSLLQLAALAGGRYWNASTDESEIGQIVTDLGGLNRTDFAERTYMVYQERFQFPLAIAILLFLLELSLPARKLSPQDSRLPRHVARKLFPAASASLIAFILFASLESPARASPVETYVENEKGVQAYKKGQIEEAKQSFGKAQALDPSRPELEYNQGLVQLQEGQVDDAIRTFGDTATKSMGSNPDLASRSFYNLGIAQAKKGDVRGAVKSYLGAIAEGDLAHDGEIDEAARKNLELLAQQEQQKKQQQQQQQQQQNQQSKSQQQQQQNGQKNPNQKDQSSQQQKQDQQGGQGNQKQQQNQPKQYADSPKQQFKSQKLSPEDADRVVSELANREKELQAKLKAHYGRVQDDTQDW